MGAWSPHLLFASILLDPSESKGVHPSILLTCKPHPHPLLASNNVASSQHSFIQMEEDSNFLSNDHDEDGSPKGGIKLLACECMYVCGPLIQMRHGLPSFSCKWTTNLPTHWPTKPPVSIEGLFFLMRRLKREDGPISNSQHTRTARLLLLDNDKEEGEEDGQIP